MLLAFPCKILFFLNDVIIVEIIAEWCWISRCIFLILIFNESGWILETVILMKMHRMFSVFSKHNWNQIVDWMCHKHFFFIRCLKVGLGIEKGKSLLNFLVCGYKNACELHMLWKWFNLWFSYIWICLPSISI